MVSNRFANIEKPTSTDAMFISSTVRRAEVRRSTSGCPTFSSYGNQISSAPTVITTAR